MNTASLPLATFAAGCFWGVEHKFARRPGVVETRVGYIGGHIDQPSYRQVCTDTTGHAEAVELRFDPQQTDFESLLRYFFEIHNPTTLNRQGPDFGSQYRSAIFFHDEAQRQTAQQIIDELDAGRFGGRIVTQLVPAGQFWPAEEYHQKYGEKHPGHHCTL